MFLKVKDTIKDKLDKIYNDNLVVEAPTRQKADLAIPLFKLARDKDMNISDLANEIITHLKDEKYIDELVFERGFLNIFLNKVDYSNDVVKQINNENEEYPKIPKNDQVVCIDYSSPNIAKNFSVGHLRSTVIGAAIKRIYEKTGHDVVGVNHLGDWGTQFGKLIVAYNKWGNEEGLSEEPIAYLQKLYVKFHDEEKNNPELEDEGREIFKRLEDGDEEIIKLWEKFRDLSIVEFIELYDRLGVSFDHYQGESFYNDKMEQVIDLLEDKNLLKLDQGAQIVDLEEHDMPPALIKRADGATLYMTRDLAAVIYRREAFNAKKILYVVGNEQKLHFEQLKKVTELAGIDADIEHVNFGLFLIDGKKMTTRKGRVVILKDVLDEATELAYKTIKDKNPNLENKEQAAESIGVSAIIFNDLKNDRNLDIEFDLEQMLSYEGLTGPYLQYSSVRIYSMLKDQVITEGENLEVYDDEVTFELVKELSKFSDILFKATNENAPYLVARYLLNIAKVFNQFYAKNQVIVDDEKTRNTNLSLIKAVRTVLNEGMRILGMTVLNEM